MLAEPQRRVIWFTLRLSAIFLFSLSLGTWFLILNTKKIKSKSPLDFKIEIIFKCLKEIKIYFVMEIHLITKLKVWIPLNLNDGTPL